MDPTLIYVKTAAGENAIQQRTRVIQRNVRMVLILVDGQSSVGDLSRKTGNPQLTENALTELEKGGFIELTVERHDSLWEESKRVAQEIRSAAIENAIQYSSTQESWEKYPDFKQSTPPVRSFPDLKSSASDIPISLHSMFDTKDEAEFSTSQFSLAPDEPETPKYSSPAKEPKATVKEGKVGRRIAKKDAVASKPSVVAQLKSLWASADRDLDEEPVKLKPLQRTTKSRIGWPAIVVVCLAGAVLLGYLAVLFFPFGNYLPDVETAFTAAVGRPVKIGTMRAEVSPVPGLILGDVRLGQGEDEIRIREIYLQPEMVSLFSPRKEFRKAVVRGVKLGLEKVSGMPAVFASLADPKSALAVGQIQLEKADVSFSGIVLNDVEAEIRRDAAGQMQSLAMRSADKSLNLVAAPVAGGIDLTAEAFGWRAAEGSKFYFDSLNFKGKLEKEILVVSGLEMRIFDGLIQGEVVVRAGAGATPNLSGNVVFERINAARLGDALGIGKRLVGETAGKIRFTAASDEWPTIFASIIADGDFSVQRGSISGIDLAEAVRRFSGTPVQGGGTAFEQLSGRMKLTPEKKQFYALAINSGLMQSTGHVDVVKDRRLVGRLELQMKGSANQTRVPVSIGGTLDSPTVQAIGR